MSFWSDFLLIFLLHLRMNFELNFWVDLWLDFWLISWMYYGIHVLYMYAKTPKLKLRRQNSYERRSYLHKTTTPSHYLDSHLTCQVFTGTTRKYIGNVLFLLPLPVGSYDSNELKNSCTHLLNYQNLLQ
jgi:hypothetical protein